MAKDLEQGMTRVFLKVLPPFKIQWTIWQHHYRQRLVPSPAGSHELHKLELSWAWEPRDSSRTRQPCANKGPLRLVFLRNMDR